MTERAAFEVWAITAVFMFLKMYANSAIQGLTNLRNKHFSRPDDAAFFGRGSPVAAEELPIVKLAAACWRNDLENIPIFLFLGLAFVGLGGESETAKIYFMVFAIARVLHTLFYLTQRQPHRNLCYQIGTLVMFGLCVQIAMIVFS